VGSVRLQEAVRRFLIDSGAVGEVVGLPDGEAAHARRVLRVKPGDKAVLIDRGGALFEAEFLEVGERVSAKIMSRLPDARLKVALTLYQGLPKFDKLEFIVQKAAELGAARVVPVRMACSVVKLDAEEGKKKQERLQKIALEAMKQCGRAGRLEILEPVKFEGALKMFCAEELMLMPWEEARGFRLGDAYAEKPDARAVGILIGPEGGIAPEEAVAACEAGALSVTLGPRILRAETAAVAAMAITMHLWGDV
jgi:16S rRNA (uracil1498-N3)-methyltransferase